MRTAVTLLLLSISLFAAKLTSEEVISKSEAFLEAKQYDSVVVVTRSYLKSNGKSDKAENVVPYLMEAEVRKGKYSRFSKLRKNFKKRFPNSPKLSRVYYLSGIVEAKTEEYVDAVISFSVSEGYSATDEEKALVKKNVDLLARNHLTLDELHALTSEPLSPLTREAIAYFYAIRMRNSDPVAAEELDAKFKFDYPASKYDLAQSITVKKEDQQVAVFENKTVAIMAPLTGKNKRLGKEALNSFSLLLAQHEEQTGEKITLVVVDTKGNPVVTALKTAELIERKVSAIVGPIMSNTATVAASMLMSHPEIVMITPTATDDGIGSLGKNIFQLNLTTKALADKVARYSIQGLGITEFAILAPISDYGRLMSDYFTTSVLNYGGEVLFTDYFTASAHDHRAQFTALRNFYADRKFGSTDSAYKLSQADQKARARFMEDSTIAVGGLFVPSMADNAVKIAAEVPFYKVQTQLLGSNGWKNNTLILDGGQYVNGAVLSTGHSVSKTGEAWKAFSTAFGMKYDVSPGQMVAPLVYDAGSLLIKAMNNSATGSDIAGKLWVTAGYQGLSGEVSLDNNDGVNTGAVIMKVSGGKFIRLQ